MYGKRIKQIREMRGMTQQELAELASIHSVSVSRYESNKVVADTVSIASIAKVLECSADYLIGVTEDPFPTKLDITLHEQRVLSAMRRGDKLSAIAEVMAG